VRLFRRASPGRPDTAPLSLRDAWSDVERSGGAVDALENCARAARYDGGGSAWRLRVLAALYLLGASLEGPVSVPSNATFRFGGLAAAIIGDLGLLRDTEASPLTEAITAFYLRLRGRLGGSMYAPRDVQEAFAGASVALLAIATDPAKFDVVARLFAELRSAPLSQRTAERHSLIMSVATSWPTAQAREGS
jgi:hypothetical protein